MAISETTFRQVVLEDPDTPWELHCGHLRSKPTMTMAHNEGGRFICFMFMQQLGIDDYIIASDNALLRVSTNRYYRPDFAVIPREQARQVVGGPDNWEMIPFPLPLVGEVWSPSNSDAERREKVQGYQERGDQEIWLLHPRNLTLTIWLRQPDGAYSSSDNRAGIVSPSFLPQVRIDLDELWRRLRW